MTTMTTTCTLVVPAAAAATAAAPATKPSSYTCDLCGTDKKEEDFGRFQWASSSLPYPLACWQCETGRQEKKVCRMRGCHRPLGPEHYTPRAWGEADFLKFQCRTCAGADRDRNLEARAAGVLCPLRSWYERKAGGYYETTFAVLHRFTPDDREAFAPDKVAVPLREDRPPSVQELAGSYDLVYFAGTVPAAPRDARDSGPWKNWIGDEICYSRAVRGGLVVATDPCGLLVATAQMEEQRAFGHLLPRERWDGRQLELRGGPNVVGRRPLPPNALAVARVRGGDDGDRGDEARRAATGFVHIVAERAAVPRCRDARGQSDLLRDLPNSIAAHEGDALMRTYRDVQGSWMCTRLSLPEDVALHVRRFLSPEPVLFFEPGDLWIRGLDIGEGTFAKGQPPLLVARRRRHEL